MIILKNCIFSVRFACEKPKCQCILSVIILSRDDHQVTLIFRLLYPLQGNPAPIAQEMATEVANRMLAEGLGKTKPRIINGTNAIDLIQKQPISSEEIHVAFQLNSLPK